MTAQLPLPAFFEHFFVLAWLQLQNLRHAICN